MKDNLIIYSQLSSRHPASHKRPPPVSDHFENNCFVSQSSTVSKTLSKATTAQFFLSDGNHFLGHKFDIFYYFMFLVSDHLRRLSENRYSGATKVQFCNSADRY